MKKNGSSGFKVEEQKQRIVQEVRRLQLIAGQKSPPFDPGKLASLLNTRVVTAAIRGSSFLTPARDGGFIITINANFPRRRQRMLCAHEIAHIFLYDTSTSPPSKLNYGLPSAWHEEDICNFVAAEILMPEEATLRSLSRYEYPSISAFFDLMEEFNVSSEFVAWRISLLRMWRIIIVLCRLLPDSSIDRGILSHTHTSVNCSEVTGPLTKLERLRVWKVYKHPDYKSIHVKRTYIDDHLGPAIALRTGSEVIKRESWRLEGTEGLVLAQSKAIQDSLEPLTISILTIDKELQKAQLKRMDERFQLSMF